MTMIISTLNPNAPIGDLEALLHDQNGLLVPAPSKELKKFSNDQIRLFCHKHGYYQLPTTELIDFLRDQIGDRTALEIGSGNGCFGRALGIRMTDSKLQDDPLIGLVYAAAGQPTVNYADDVEKIDANSAVKTYKPEVVIASWVTHLLKDGMSQGNMYGIEEEDFFNHGVIKYVHVGNLRTHMHKPLIKKMPVEIIFRDWLISRSAHPTENAIFIFKEDFRKP